VRTLACGYGSHHLRFSWFGRKGPFLRPGLTDPRCPRAAAVKDGRSHRACAARSVLDGSERGARLERMNPTREDAEGAGLNDTTLMQQALGLPAAMDSGGAHFDAEAIAWMSRSTSRQGSRFACRPAARPTARPTTRAD